MSVELCDLFDVTVYPPHYVPLCDKQKQKKIQCGLLIFHSLSLAETVPGMNSWYLYLKLRLVP